MSKAKLTAIIVLSTICSFIFTNDAAIANNNSSHKFRNIQLEKFRGLPRLGIQNSSGMIIPGEQSTLFYRRINQNPARKAEIGNRIERHNYSLSLLRRLDFISKNSGCFKAMNGYEVRTEICNGVVIDQNNQKDFWKKYIETMAYSLQKHEHSKSFCTFDPDCLTRNIDNLYKKLSGGRMMPLDGFEKRSFVNKLMKEQYNDYEQYIKGKSFPEEAYYVSTIRLGDYDFDQNKFHFSYYYPSSILTQDQFGGAKPNTMSSKMLASGAALYEPKLPFEMGPNNNKISGIDLPMPPGEAQKLVQGSQNNRYLYAVVKIKFADNEYDTGYKVVKDLTSPISSFHLAENKIELFKDENLTQKIAEVAINKSRKNTISNTGSIDTYKFDKKTKILDYRTMSLLRYKKDDLLESDMDKIAYSLPSTEKRIWAKHKQRVDQANKPLQSATDKKYQEMLKNMKIRAEKAAKFTNINWQDRNTLSREQKKAFYDMMLGFDHYDNNILKWPDIFPSVPWGMNLATVFRKGYLSYKSEDQHIPADKKTRDILQEFIRDIAQHYKLEDLTLVYGLNNVSYDPKSKMIIFNEKEWPFYTAQNLTYTDGNIDKEQGYFNYINKKAKGRAVTLLRSSDSNIGDLYPNPPYNSCINNTKTKSNDCLTPTSAYTQLNFHNSFLALDKEIKISKIPLDIKKGTNLTKYSGRDYAGWRIVVELDKADMDVMQFEHKNAKKNIYQKSETRTLFANVKRVSIIGPNEEIIWSKKGSELPKPSLVSQKKNDIKKENAKKVNDAKILADKRMQEALKKQKKLIEENKRKYEEQRKKIQRQASVRKCEQDNRNNINIFNSCKKLRTDVSNVKNQLSKAKSNNCSSEGTDIKPVNGCDFSNTPLQQLTIKMQECITERCGSPAMVTIADMANYKICTKGIAEDMKMQMSNLMGGRSNKSGNTINICKQLQNNIADYTSHMRGLKCSEYEAEPVAVNCNESIK